MPERRDIDYTALIERLGRANSMTKLDVLLSLIKDARDAVDTLRGDLQVAELQLRAKRHA